MLNRLNIRTRQVLSSSLSGLLAVLLIVATPLSVSAETLPTSNSPSGPTLVVLPSPSPDPSPSPPPATTPTGPITPAPAPTPAPTPSPTPTPTPTPSPTPSTAAPVTLPIATLTPTSSPSPVVSPATDTLAPHATTAVEGVVDATKQTLGSVITNNIDSKATTGGASVTDSHRAGDATSGPASSTATLVNVVGHSTGLGSATTFIHDVYNTPGSNEIQGNIIIDPSTLMPTSATDGTVTTNLFNTAGIDSLTNITNNVSLNAASGNADVLNNYKAGGAITGDATAMANVINIVNSSIGARNTFLGVVNIYGNLRGDILVPSSVVDSLLSDSGSIGSTDNSGTGSLTSNININNNVDLSAVSGNATVQDNYKAGNATSGDAMTNLTVFNLTGQQVIAKNSLLVFVNVLGKWVGMIVNAPAGSTSAALTGGGSSDSNGLPAGDYTDTVNITNNIKVAATSGNATVQGNYKAGGATSGNATAGANVLNLVHSSFSLDDWFGILFINVLGSWLGNFGIAPDTTVPPANDSDTPISQGGIQGVKVFRFNRGTTVKRSGQSEVRNFDSGIATTASTTPLSGGQVLGARTQRTPSLPQGATRQDNTAAILMFSGLILLLALALTLIKRHREARHSHLING